MFSTEEGIPVCTVKGGKGDGEIIFVTEEEKKHKIVRGKPIRYIDVRDGVFQQMPSDTVRVMYVAGPSGSGKSTYTADYSFLFQKIYPDSKIILFSRVHSDPALEGLDYKRVVLTEDLVENPLQIEEVEEGSLVIFDDIDTISNEELRKSLFNFQGQILEIGRHRNVKCIITSHLINGNDKKQTRTIMNEAHSVTIFPKAGSLYHIKYYLKQYFGLSVKQINAIVALESRWVTLFKSYPQIVLTQHEGKFVSLL